MRIGVLTGGGDCPGLNAVIRAVVRTCDVRYGSSVVGFHPLRSADAADGNPNRRLRPATRIPRNIPTPPRN